MKNVNKTVRKFKNMFRSAYNMMMSVFLYNFEVQTPTNDVPEFDGFLRFLLSFSRDFSFTKHVFKRFLLVLLCLHLLLDHFKLASFSRLINLIFSSYCLNRLEARFKSFTKHVAKFYLFFQLPGRRFSLTFQKQYKSFHRYQDKIPPDKIPPDKIPPRTKSPWTKSPLGKNPPGQNPPSIFYIYWQYYILITVESE